MDRNWAVGMIVITKCVVGCAFGGGSGDYEAEPVPSEAPSQEATSGSGPEAYTDAESVPVAPSFEAFELGVDREVTVGSFVLDLGSARVAPSEGRFGLASVVLTFSAHNQSELLQWPLGDLDSDGLLLEAAGEFFYGTASGDAVPGLRDGEGSVEWEIFGEDVIVEDLRQAVLTFGHANQNQVVVPLADPNATVSMADVPLDAVTIEGFRSTTFAFDDVRVQYSTRSGNSLLPAGTAWLVMQGLMIADPGTPPGGVEWNQNNVFLDRPDGVSVAPRSLIELSSPGDRTPLILSFELDTPVSGTYVFGVTATDRAAETRELVVP